METMDRLLAYGIPAASVIASVASGFSQDVTFAGLAAALIGFGMAQYRSTQQQLRNDRLWMTDRLVEINRTVITALDRNTEALETLRAMVMALVKEHK